MGDTTPYWWIAVDDGNPTTSGSTDEARTGDIASIVFKGVQALGAQHASNRALDYGRAYQVTVGKPAEVWPVVTANDDPEWRGEIETRVLEVNYGVRHLGSFVAEGVQPKYVDPIRGVLLLDQNNDGVDDPFVRVRVRIGAHGDVGDLGGVPLLDPTSRFSLTGIGEVVRVQARRIIKRIDLPSISTALPDDNTNTNALRLAIWEVFGPVGVVEATSMGDRCLNGPTDTGLNAYGDSSWETNDGALFRLIQRGKFFDPTRPLSVRRFEVHRLATDVGNDPQVPNGTGNIEFEAVLSESGSIGTIFADGRLMAEYKQPGIIAAPWGQIDRMQGVAGLGAPGVATGHGKVVVGAWHCFDAVPLIRPLL